jgi:hypothetical protein
METMWQKTIGRFTVKGEIAPDDDMDLSWDDSGETREGLNDGRLIAFRTRVSVYLGGQRIGEDHLGGSVYANPSDFFSEHLDCAMENERLRAAGSAARCGAYLPDMVRGAVADARNWLERAGVELVPVRSPTRAGERSCA